MAKKKKKTQLSSEGKTELAKAIAEKGQTFTKTYENVEIQVSKFFRWISGWLDKLLFNQKHGKLIALILAILFYVTMNSDNTGLFENIQQTENLGEYQVSAIISSQAYEVTNLPESVRVRIIGDLSDIKSVKQQKNFRVVANMTDLTEGTHEVKFTTEGAPSRVEVEIIPSNAIVTIKKKSIRSFSLGYDYVNRNKMDAIYDLSVPEFEQGEVYVRASSETLDQIAFVKALIDVKDGFTTDFETKAGIAAYDKNGNKMNVDIIPETIKAKVKVTSPSKEVPITLVPNGTIPNNKAIASYSMDYPIVTIYAKQSVLDVIHELPIRIPASTLTSDREISMPIIPPNGVTKSNQTLVNISIKLADAESTKVDSVPVTFSNGIEGLKFAFENSVESSTSVTITGAKGIIEGIVKDDLHVYIDVSKIDKAGTYELPLIVEGKNKLATYTLKNNATAKIVVSGSVKTSN